MSSQAPLSGGNPNARPTTNGSGGGSVSMAQPRSADNSIGGSSGGSTGGISQQNLNGIVSAYHFPSA